MTAALSPAACRGIFSNLIERQRDLETVKGKGDCEMVTRYRCPACEVEYEERAEAVECCGEEVTRPRMACPVCDGETRDSFDAVECCLWKDLDAPTRWRLASLVDSGTPMLEAIQQVGGKA